MKRRFYQDFSEPILGAPSTTTNFRLFVGNPSVGITKSRGTALFTSIALLITNEYISKLKETLY